MSFPGTITITPSRALKQTRWSMALHSVESPHGEAGFTNEHWSKTAGDGPKACGFLVYGDEMILRHLFLAGLMREVHVLAPDGRDLWGGVIWSLTYDNGRHKFTRSMDDLYNEWWVRYQATGTGTTIRGDVYPDQDSKDFFATRQGVLVGGELENAGVAGQYASRMLTWNSMPMTSPEELRLGQKIKLRPQSVTVSCVGWKDLLNMQVYNKLGGGAGYASEIAADVVGMPSLRRSLVAWWDLAETGVTDMRMDAEGENDLQAVNSPTQGAGPGSVSAIYLALASSQYLTCPSSPALSMGDIPFSSALWAYLTTNATGQKFLTKGQSDIAGSLEYTIEFNLATNRWAFDLYLPTDSIVACRANTLGAPATGTWYFITAWHDPSTDMAYIQVNNGVIDSQATGGALQPPLGGRFSIGRSVLLGTPQYVDGRVAAPILAKRLWTTTERAWLYNNGLGRTHAEISRCPFLRDAVIAGNSTPVTENYDFDRRMGDILESLAEMGDPAGQRWGCWVTPEAELHFEAMPPPMPPVA